MENQIIKKLQDALDEFGKAVFYMKANEKSYQGWLTHFLVKRFGIGSVYRETDFLKRHLTKGFKNELAELFQSIVKSNKNFYCDFAIAYDTIDNRNLTTRDTKHYERIINEGKSQYHGSAKDILLQLSIIGELKVSGSVKKRESKLDTPIKRDIIKLALFSATREIAQSEHNIENPFYPIMVIVDNYSDEDFGVYKGNKFSKILGFTKSWKNFTFVKPIIFVIRKRKENHKIEIDRWMYCDEEGRYKSNREK